MTLSVTVLECECGLLLKYNPYIACVKATCPSMWDYISVKQTMCTSISLSDLYHHVHVQ